MIPSAAIPPMGAPTAPPESLCAVGVGVLEVGAEEVCDDGDADAEADPGGAEEDSIAKAPIPLGTTDGAGSCVPVKRAAEDLNDAYISAGALITPTIPSGQCGVGRRASQ